jgi:UDP-galactopyranose mutase
MAIKYDYLIVGAGYSGAVFARLVAEKKGKKVLVIDKRPHIGGNAYDSYDGMGILIHNYGPHIFHTQSKKVWDFLSQYTRWHYYQHWVLSNVDGQLVPVPINVKTINMLYGTNYTAENISEFYNKRKVNIAEIKTSKDVIVSQIGEELYEKFFANYTKKQWGVLPDELDKSVTSRIPIRYNLDCRYFADKYQAMPIDGYTKMFSNMLKHPNIDVKLGVDFNSIKGKIAYTKLVYTGKIDEFFDFKYGKLPYRSLEFEFESFNIEHYQKAPVVNYPNDYDFTRITEYKYLTGQKAKGTTISREYSKSEGEAYYPVPNIESAKLLKKYQDEVSRLENTYFIGRLAEYKYYNMDNVVLKAIEKFEEVEEV